MKEQLFISNAFSLSMLTQQYNNLEFSRYTTEEIIEFIQESLYDNPEIEIVSAIGHNDTCNIINNLLGLNLQVNRISIKLEKETNLIIAQYSGPRLPEGATTLPKDAKIEFWIANISF